MKFFCLLLAVSAATALTVTPRTVTENTQLFTLPEGLGDGLWRTFSKAIHGDAPTLPLSIQEAEAQGWIAQNGGACLDKLGIMYSQSKEGGSESHPLSVYFAANGQVAGLNVDVYGTSSTSNVGGAGPAPLVDRGIWNKINTSEKKKNKLMPSLSKNEPEWSISLSFRDGATICDKSAPLSAHSLGDRLVVNQNTIALSLPLTAKDAKVTGWVPGACMKTMGQHWAADVTSASAMTWNATYVFPIIPMFYPANISGVINAVLFTSPVVQPGSLSVSSNADWEFPPLPAAAMCQNWCDSKCSWNTKAWSTMHVYLNSQWKGITCEGGSGFVDRSCPQDE